jgi:hypothetical protein
VGVGHYQFLIGKTLAALIMMPAELLHSLNIPQWISKKSARLLHIAGIAAGARRHRCCCYFVDAGRFFCKKDYDVKVSASVTEEGEGRYICGIFTATRVSIENTGKLPLTNVSVSYTPL